MTNPQPHKINNLISLQYNYDVIILLVSTTEVSMYYAFDKNNALITDAENLDILRSKILHHSDYYTQPDYPVSIELGNDEEYTEIAQCVVDTFNAILKAAWIEMRMDAVNQEELSRSLRQGSV